MGNHYCYFENNTKYKVDIVDYNGTRTLHPGQTQYNYLLRGGYSVDLVMNFDDKKEVKINFPGSKYEKRTHKMNIAFANAIKEYEMSMVKVVSCSSKWHLICAHPCGFEEEVEVEMVSKNSWKNMEEKGGELEATVKIMILGVEQSLSAKVFMKVTRVDEFGKQITEKTKRKFKRTRATCGKRLFSSQRTRSNPFTTCRFPLLTWSRHPLLLNQGETSLFTMPKRGAKDD